MANTPTLSLRIPDERQKLIRAVADRLKRADAAGDASFGTMLTRLVEDGTPPPELQERLAAIECRLAELEAPWGGHFGERVRAAREKHQMEQEEAGLLAGISAEAIDKIERTGLVTPDMRTALVEVLHLDETPVATAQPERPEP